MRIALLLAAAVLLPAVSANVSGCETLPGDCGWNQKSYSYTKDQKTPTGQLFCWRIDCPGKVLFNYDNFKTYCKLQASGYTYTCSEKTECDRLTLTTISPPNQMVNNTGCLNAAPYPCGHVQDNAASCVPGQTEALTLTVRLELRDLNNDPVTNGPDGGGVSLNYSCPAKCPTPQPPPPPRMSIADFGSTGQVSFKLEEGIADTIISSTIPAENLPNPAWWAIYEYPHAGWAPPGGSTWADCDPGTLGGIYNWSGTNSGWFGSTLPLRARVPLEGVTSVAGRSLVVGGDNGTWKCALIGHSSPDVAAGKATFTDSDMSLTLTLNGPGGDATAVFERTPAATTE